MIETLTLVQKWILLLGMAGSGYMASLIVKEFYERYIEARHDRRGD